MNGVEMKIKSPKANLARRVRQIQWSLTTKAGVGVLLRFYSQIHLLGFQLSLVPSSNMGAMKDCTLVTTS
jgi:hypothetical protein